MLRSNRNAPRGQRCGFRRCNCATLLPARTERRTARRREARTWKKEAGL